MQAQHQHCLHQPCLRSQLQPAQLSKYKPQALLLLLLLEPCRQLWPLLQQQVSLRPLVKSREAERRLRLWMRNLQLDQVRLCLLPKQAKFMTWMGHCHMLIFLNIFHLLCKDCRCHRRSGGDKMFAPPSQWLIKQSEFCYNLPLLPNRRCMFSACSAMHLLYIVHCQCHRSSICGTSDFFACYILCAAQDYWNWPCGCLTTNACRGASKLIHKSAALLHSSPAVGWI